MVNPRNRFFVASPSGIRVLEGFITVMGVASPSGIRLLKGFNTVAGVASPSGSILEAPPAG